MLHARRSLRRTRTTPWASLGAALRALPDHVIAADPGLVRLALALRGTLSVLLTTLAAMLASRTAHVPTVVFAAGITLSMMGPFLAREPTRRQRQRTLVSLAVPAALATAATALLHGRGPAGDSAFLVLVFGCFLFQPRGPRMIGIGLVAVVSTYVGLFLELPPATLPAQLLSILAALPVIAFASFVAVPLRPALTLRWTVRAVQWRAARVLRDARLVAEADARSGARLARLTRDLRRLNEAALAADDQLTLMQPEGREALRAGLIDIELATHRMADAVRVDGADPRHHGARYAARLRLHARRMQAGRAYAMPAASLTRGSLLAVLVELGHATHALGVAASAMSPARGPAAAPALAPGPLAWRMATRVTLAAGLAMAGGMALSPNRWFWAVMTVYVVFLGSRSRGDTIYKGLQRLAGTLFGIASGLVLATLLADDPVVQVVMLLLAIFGMFYTFLVSYIAGIFFVTVMLGLLYGMLGASLETLLVLRLEETAIGALAAIAVAAFVLPARTREQVARSGRTVVGALAAAVRATRQTWSGASDAPPIVAMRQVDRQVADLRLALAPLTARRALLRRSALEPRAAALLDCVHWTRVLAAARDDGANPADVAARSARAVGIEAVLDTIAAGQIALVDADPPAVPDSGEVGQALAHLAAAVIALARRLKADAWRSFAIDA